MSEPLRSAARFARRATLTGVRALGGFDLTARSAWRQRRLLILCYHGISLQDEHEWRMPLFVTQSFLRRRFEILRDTGCVVMPLEDAIYGLRNGTLPPRSVALTFDDGFYNFYAGALPLLEEFGYPATNYVSSYHVLHQRPILTLALRYLVWCARTSAVPADFFPSGAGRLDLRDAAQREALAKHLIVQARTVCANRNEQQTWVADLSRRLSLDWDGIVRNRLFHLMTPSEIADAMRRGVDIQLHTHRHRTPRDKAAFCDELCENRRVLEVMTGKRAVHFCYPSGDVDPMFLPWLRELGVETATTGFRGLASETHDQLLLPRFVDTMAQPEVRFESWLSGAGALLP